MGLFDKIRSKITSSDGKAELPSATFATRPDVVYAPVSGMLVSLKEVKDEVLPVACSETATASCPPPTTASSTRRSTASSAPPR